MAVVSFEESAMNIALETSRRSEDPNTQVGSCIVSEENIVLCTGYNTIPKHWKGDFPWARDASLVGVENTKYPYVIHSEVNALNNYDGPKSKLENATIYVTLFPCPNCAKHIVESGIKRVVYKYDTYKDTIDALCAKRLLVQCGVEFIQYDELVNQVEYSEPVKMLKLYPKNINKPSND